MSTKSNTQTTEVPSVTVETGTSMTPYAAAKVVNAVFESQGLEKRIPVQMMYNYTKGRLNQNKKSFIEVDDKGLITPEGLKAWMVKYFTKQGIEVEGLNK